MALSLVAFIGPNYTDFNTWWLKAYEPGTTTPKTMALDSAGATTVAKLQLNADGFLESSGGALVIPYIDESYDAWLFPTEAEADANSTTNAEKVADDVNAFNVSIINDLSQAYEFATVAKYKAFTTAFPVGKVIHLLDRRAEFTVSSGVSGATGFGVIANTTVSQKITYNGEVNKVVDSREWGAIEGSGNDNLLAIQDLFDSIYTPKIGDNESEVYEVSDTVTLPAQKNLVMGGTIHYTGTQTKPCMVLGSPTTTFNRKSVQVRVTGPFSTPDWVTEDYKGVLFHNFNTCNIHIALTDNFTVGWQFLSSNNNAFAYNTVTLGHHDRNFIVGELRNNSDIGSFVNQNTFIGGRFIGSTASAHNTFSRYGIRIRSDNALFPNGNVFYSPSFEMQAASTSGNAIAGDFQNALENKILNCRNEANDIPAFLMGVGCANNEITTAFGAANVTDTSATPSTVLMTGNEKIRANSLATWNSQHLGRTATAWDATDVNVPELDVISSGGAAGVFLNGFSIANNGYLETTSARGVLVSIDTTGTKQFVVRRNALDGFGGRVLIKAYDAAGVLLTGVAPKYITGQRGLDFSDVATYGGGYQTGGDSNGDVYFNCHEDVFSVDVAITSGTAHIKLIGFSVSAVNSNASTSLTVFRRSDANEGKDRWANQAPTFGSYSRGTRVYKYLAAVGQPIGWICTVSGTPGTWVAMANL